MKKVPKGESQHTTLREFTLRSRAHVLVIMPSTLTDDEVADVVMQLRDFATTLEKAR